MHNNGYYNKHDIHERGHSQSLWGLGVGGSSLAGRVARALTDNNNNNKQNKSKSKNLDGALKLVRPSSFFIENSII